MQFETGYLYHIYNQGNNRQKIFFNRENYLFFLKKIRSHVKPYCDVLAWALLPNHFHLMVKLHRCALDIHQVTPSHQVNEPSERTLNQNIATLLRSYTRAINKQENRSGSLFRHRTKAICLNSPKGITPAFFDTEFGTQIYRGIPEKQYPQVCFNYIHQNPVKAGLVKRPEDWEFSSYADYAGLRDGQLVSRKVAEKFVLI